MKVRALLALASLALALTLAAATPASALKVVGYGGGSPFRCKLQQAGRGTDIPRPHADPLCVEYDKTNQNIDQLGFVRFLSGEPTRFALAGDKCFYLQRDHWRGSVQQDVEQTETYHWDGWYFFDRARGVAGAYVENFTINNKSGDPTTFPGFPPQYKPFFSYGRGGAQATDSVPIDPSCVQKAKRDHVYAPPPRLRLALAYRRGRNAADHRCAHGRVGARVVGRDARHALRVGFRAAGQPIAEDERAPFTARIEHSRLRGRGVTRLVARVLMRDGRRVSLDRSLRRCH